jgi:hypothetical protein
MSTVVTGRFDCLIQAEEAMSESLLRFSREDVVLVPPPGRQEGRSCSFVLIRAKRQADRRLAVRTLQGRGAEAVEVVVMPAAARAEARVMGRMAAAA